jgi:hypothetical protein
MDERKKFANAFSIRSITFSVALGSKTREKAKEKKVGNAPKILFSIIQIGLSSGYRWSAGQMVKKIRNTKKEPKLIFFCFFISTLLLLLLLSH